MQIIPLQPIPAQTLNIVLGGQNCAIAVYHKTTGLFIDLVSNGVTILTGQVCRDRDYIVRLGYLGFQGDLAFMDTQGTSDPDYTGLGSRYVLMYLVNGQ